MFHVVTALLGVWVLLPAAVFVVLYGGFVRRRSWTSWHLLAFTAVFALLVGNEVAVRLWGLPGWHHWFMVTLIIAGGALLWQRLWWLWSSTFRSRDPPKHG